MLFLKTEVKKHVGEGTLRLGEGKGNRGANAGGSVSNQLRVKVICVWGKGVGRKGQACRISCSGHVVKSVCVPASSTGKHFLPNLLL